MGFCIVSLDTPSHQCRGMALFYKGSPRFMSESHQQHGPNVISFNLVTGGRYWNMVGCCLMPRDASTLESISVAIGHRTRGSEILVASNFNIDLESPDGNKCNKAIVEAIAIDGIEDMAEHYLPCNLPWKSYRWTCIIIHHGQEVRSQMDYILGTDRHLFLNVSVRDPRHNTEHYMVLGCLHGVTLREHQH